MKKLIFLFLLLFTSLSIAEVVKVGSGSYTTKPPQFINGDAGGRPTNVYGPCFSTAVDDLKWQPIYPAVTEKFRQSGKRITTNQFWSSIIFKFNGGTFSNTMHPMPLVVKCAEDGIRLNNQRTIFVDNNVPSGIYTTASIKVDVSPVTTMKIGIDGVTADSTLVDDYSDWFVRAAWKKDSVIMKATFGRGSPFVYFDGINQKVRLSNNDINTRFSTWYHKESDNCYLGIKNESTKEYWLLCLPEGSSVTFFDQQPSAADTIFFKSILIDLKGKEFFSIATVFDYDVSEETVQLLKKYAFSFISDTKVDWNYDETTGYLTTNFNFTTEAKQGTETNTIIGLFPHQYNNLNQEYTFSNLKYPVIRGWLKTIEGKSFSTKLKFSGILQSFPNVFPEEKKDTLEQFLKELDKLLLIQLVPDYNTSYGHGKSTFRILSAAKAANCIEDSAITAIAKKWRDRVKLIIENWLSTSDFEVDSAKASGLHWVVIDGDSTLVPDSTSIGNYLLFFYNQAWNSIYGLPAGFNTETEFNDHHFTWGYFIRALVELMETEGKSYGKDDKWGGMIKMLIRDIIGDYRKVSDGGISDNGDPMFPRFRNWDPYIGYGLASGHSSFNDGNNQESSSEAMNFISSVALFGGMNEDTYYRDLGIYLYSTQLSTIENYWFDVNKKNFWREPREWNKVLGNYVRAMDSAAYAYPFITIAWDSKSEMTSFFSPSFESVLGIELLPYSPSSVYLGRYPEWGKDVYNALQVMKIDNPKSKWQNIIWQLISLYHSDEAIDEFDSFRDFTKDSEINQEIDNNYGENGTTRSYTYYWLHTVDSLGRLDTTIHTLSTPYYAVFINQHNHKYTYIAFNPKDVPLNVTFSDGESFQVPAFSTGTSNKPAKLAMESFVPNLKSYESVVDFDTVKIGEVKKRMFSYYNNSDTTQVIDDVEIIDTTAKGFYLKHLDEEKRVISGHTYNGIIGFKPKEEGLTLDTLIIDIDAGTATPEQHYIHLIGFVLGNSSVNEKEYSSKILTITTAPNPASDFIEIYFNDGIINSGTQIHLIDMNGNQIINEITKAEMNKYQIPLNNFASGTYILNIISNGASYNSKIIIVK